MNYWILKTEPSTYSFEDLMRDKKTRWEGVRNYQARNNLRAMKIGDSLVIYHSGEVKAAVGLGKIIKTAFKDPTSEADWSAVEIKATSPLKNSVSLSKMKLDKTLKKMMLVKNSRLSVSPLTREEYDLILSYGKS